jgi:hypothetical protein
MEARVHAGSVPSKRIAAVEQPSANDHAAGSVV